MPDYNSAEDYIAKIQKMIKWKRAKVTATREIADHIADQCDAYIDGGCSSKEALNRTLNEMGDPTEIGEKLNILHRPRMNWSLLVLTVAFVALGTLSDVVLLNVSYTRDILAVILGCVLASVMRFVDYTIAIRFPRICYFSLLILTVLAIAYDSRNGLQIIGYSYSFYLLLLFPIVQALVAFQIKINRSEIGALKLALYLMLPLLGAALISSVPAIICLSISDAILLAYVLLKKWYPINGTVLLGFICIIAVCTISLLYINSQTNMWNNFFNSNGDFVSELTRDSVFHAKFMDASSSNTYVDNPEYAIARLTMRYGWCIIAVVSFLFVIYVFMFVLTIRKQIDFFGQFISCQILVLFISQFILSMLGNMGMINGSYMIPFPFISSGGVFTVYNLCLIGIILSVCRYQDIAKDWMQLISQRTKKEVLYHD